MKRKRIILSCDCNWNAVTLASPVSFEGLAGLASQLQFSGAQVRCFDIPGKLTERRLAAEAGTHARTGLEHPVFLSSWLGMQKRIAERTAVNFWRNNGQLRRNLRQQRKHAAEAEKPAHGH